MRTLAKLAEPDVLVRRGDEWTDAYVAAVKAGDAELRRKAERWRHRQIKERLHEETSGKCAYCEAIIGDVSYPQVEHIVPKALHPELAHRWANLTWACSMCNGGKSAYYDAENGVLNPYDEPELSARFVFHGDFVDARLGDTRAEVTIRLCDLNRLELVKSRIARLRAMKDLLVRWHESEGALRFSLEAAIRLDCADGEFTATVSAFLARHGFPISEPDLDEGTAAS